MNQIPSVVTSAFVASVCPDKQALYEALSRNQYYLPPAKDAIMSTEFMRGVVDQIYWLPKTSEVKIANCADPPSKHDLVRILGERMMHMDPQGDPFDTQFRRTCIKIKLHPPSVSWMLIMMATMSPDHEIFKKDWVKQKPLRPGCRARNEVRNIGDFFTGLPTQSRKKGKATISFGSNKQE